MNRLTKRGREMCAGLSACFDECDHVISGCDCPRVRGALNRLAAYEDTGLMPEEIEGLVQDKLQTATVDIGTKSFDIAVKKAFKDTYGISLDRFTELAKADKDGRCFIFLVKPGEFVQFKRNKREKSKVNAITFYDDGQITFSFHDYGIKETFVDDWSEDSADNYEPCVETEVSLKSEKEKKE